MWKIKKRVYSDANFLNKAQIPLWFYLLGAVLAFIPIFGLIGIIILAIYAFREVKVFPNPKERYYYTDYFYKPGRILNFFKKIVDTLQKPL